MKQIKQNDLIKAKLQRSVGDGVDVSKHKVFEAIALNTRPLRKESPPIYKGAIVDRSILLEMAAALELESRPIQIMHNRDVLPVGRVFHGEVVDRGAESELRVLFFMDAAEEDSVSKINNGTVDQVSVSILPKQAISSASGFDFLGEGSKPEMVWMGRDDKGNVIGKNGVYARLVGLAKFSELSLVNTGGAENARIVSHKQSYFADKIGTLAANGVDYDNLILDATTGTEKMELDLSNLVEKLSTSAVELSNKTREVTELTASLTSKDAKIAELEANITALGEPATALATAQADLAAANTEKEAAVLALKNVATKVLTQAGKLNEKAPDSVADLVLVIDDTASGLSAALANVNKSRPADSGQGTGPSGANPGAFRVRR